MQQIRKLHGGKRQGGTTVNSAVPQPTNSGDGDLLFILDAVSRRKWLIDGGAFVSIRPPTTEERRAGPTSQKLQAANGTNINCFGETEMDVYLGNRVFRFTVVIADVQHSILGADFLAANYLAPNHCDKNLIDLNDFSTIDVEIDNSTETSRVNFVGEKEKEKDSPYYKLLDEFPALSTPNFTLKEVKHGVRHFIPTSGRPVQSRARKLHPDKLAVAKAEIEKLCQLGVCRRSKSNFSSPLLVVDKPGGGYRVCGDYRRLNCQTEEDKYPVRNISDFNAELAGKKVFSKVDLLKGYHQIPVADEDVRKTAVITPFGLFEFPRTPFGLKNAGQDFQRLMDEILADLPHVFVYIDDILVASNSHEEHLQDLQRLFKTLEDNGLVVNRAKCVFGQTSLEFLGYKVTQAGVEPLEERVTAIRETVAPTTVKELQRFLGLVNYYRRFISRAAHHLFHLFEALKGKPKTLTWTAGCQESFDAIKDALAKATMLHHPRPGAPLAITSDASKIALGAVLEQRGPKGWEPLGYFSARLKTEKPDQTAWPPFDRELLGVFRSVRHFRHMVEGRPFTIYTDQQALIPGLHKKTEAQTARQTYQLSCIAEFSTDIRYVEGKANVVADALSRPNGEERATVNAVSSAHIFLQEMAAYGIISSVTSLNNIGFDPRGATSQINSGSTPGGATSHNSNFGFDSDGATSQNNSASNASTTAPATATPGSKGKAVTFTPISHIDRPVEQQHQEELKCIVNAINNVGIDLAAMANDQPLDNDFQRISNDARSGLNFRRVDVGQSTLLVDVSNGMARPFVPYNWRRRVFNALHGLGHPGVHRSQQIVSGKFVWPNVNSDCAKWARECVDCQRAKITRHTVPPIGNFEVPSRRFSHLHADLVKLPTSNGFNHLLTIVDRFTRWPTAIPLKDMTAESVVDAFTHGWIATYGIPQAITTDRGTQFTSAIWMQLLQTWGIKPLHTTAYHPEANGMVERLHRRLKESLMALCAESPHNWFWKLPMSLLAIRTTLKPDVGSSPADLVFGEGLALPGELLGPVNTDNDDLQRQREATLANLRVEVARLQPTPASAHRQPRVFLPASLDTASHVFVRRGGVQPSLTSPYEGPFRVVSRAATGYKVHLPGGRTETIALSRLKPAHIATDDVDGEGSQGTNDGPPTSPRTARAPPRREPNSQETSEPQQPNNATPAPAPSARRRQRVRNIDEYNVPPPPQPPPVPPPPPPPQSRSFDDWLAMNVSDPPSTSNEPNRHTSFFTNNNLSDAQKLPQRRRPDVSVIFQHLGQSVSTFNSRVDDPAIQPSRRLGGM